MAKSKYFDIQPVETCASKAFCIALNECDCLMELSHALRNGTKPNLRHNQVFYHPYFTEQINKAIKRTIKQFLIREKFWFDHKYQNRYEEMKAIYDKL